MTALRDAFEKLAAAYAADVERRKGAPTRAMSDALTGMEAALREHEERCDVLGAADSARVAVALTSPGKSTSDLALRESEARWARRVRESEARASRAEEKVRQAVAVLGGGRP